MISDPAHSCPEVFTQWMRITTNRHKTLSQKIQDILELLRGYMNLDVGILSRIEGMRYDVFAVDAPGMPITPGVRFELASTYCERTITCDYVNSFHHAARDKAWSCHPAYAAFSLEAYIGVSITVDEQRFGTLNFSSTLPRRAPFSLLDHQLVTLTAQWIGREFEVEQREARARHEALMLKQSVAAARDHALCAARAQHHLLERLYQELHMPLRGIASLSMQLTQYDDLSTLSPQQRLEAIHTSSAHLIDMVSDVLDRDALSEIHHAPRAEDFSLHTLFEEVATLLAPMAHQKGLYLDICFDTRLPDEVCGDPVRLRQVMMNLLGDSITRTESGGIFLYCSIEHWEEVSKQALLLIDIQDTSTRPLGAHSSPQDSLAMTQPRGSIGVEIAVNLVDMLGGKVDERIVEEQGVERRVILPMLVSAASPATPPVQVATTAWVAIEHDPLLMCVETSCARYGARLVKTPSRAQVCLLDADLPEIEQRIADLRANHKSALIYVLVEPSRFARFEGLHLDGLLDKPVRQRQIIDLLVQADELRHLDTQTMSMTVTLSLEMSVDDLELGQWLLPPSFEDLASTAKEATLFLPVSGKDPARATLPSSILAQQDSASSMPSLSEAPKPHEDLPVLDISIYEEFATHQDEALFLRDLTRDFFVLGAKLLSRLEQCDAEERARPQLLEQLEEMCNTSNCLGLLKVHAQCEHICARLPRGRAYEAFSADVRVLGELLEDARAATQERFAGVHLAS